MPEIVLRVREPDQSEQRVVLASGARVGRATDNDLKLVDPAASRHHLAFVYEAGAWFVEDVKSKTGTIVDGAQTLRNGERAPLKNGTEITAGDTVLIVTVETEVRDATQAKGAGPKMLAKDIENTLPYRPPIMPKPKASRPPSTPAAGAPAQAPANPELARPEPANPEPDRRTPPPATPGSDRAPAFDPDLRTIRAPDRTVAGPPMPGARKTPAPQPSPPPILDANTTPSSPASRSANTPPDTPATPPRTPASAGSAPSAPHTRPLGPKEQEALLLRPKLASRAARMILVGPGMRRVVSIDCTPFAIGRSDHSQLMLDDDAISTEHAHVVFHGDRFSLLDLGSKNGTFVGTQRLPPRESWPLTLPAWVTFGTVEAWIVDDTALSAEQERLDRRVCDVLVRAGRLTGSDRRQALAAARSSRRPISETVLQQTRLMIAEWVDAVQRAPAHRTASGKWWLLAVTVLAAAGAAYWLTR